ncbi:baseplate J/gp47 family protein [Photobacterium damselae]|uniref:baseplate J/gp47 family protein n=1 Tax=Photobacterium damselae TaxID=38293 RepID=UPI002F3E22B9
MALNNEHTEFERVLKNSNIPTTENDIHKAFDDEVKAQGSLINNDPKYSPFWRLVLAIVTKPYMWLLSFLIKTVLPQSFVKTSSGFFLDLYLHSVNLKRKPANKARGYVIFEREPGAPEIQLPAGFTISTERINNNIYKLIIPDEIVLPANIKTMRIECIAENTGGAFNLAGGYYCIPMTPLPGLIRVYNPDDWLSVPGADIEADADAKERYRAQFTAVSGWYIDDKYKLIMSEFGGVKTDQIYIEKNGPRGPGTANAYLLLDSGTATEPFLDAINNAVRVDGYHGLGDDMITMALPDKPVDIELEVLPVPNLKKEQLETLYQEIDQYIRCVFRENQAYQDAMKTWPLTLFSFSTLNQELRNTFPNIESLYFVNRDFKCGMEIARINTLTIRDMPNA